MELEEFGESEPETIEIKSARQVVLCSLLVQRSLTPLDLSACEYSLMLRPVSTEEQYRQKCDPRRKILYTLHLDLPKDMDRNSRTTVLYEAVRYISRRQTFNLATISVNELVYNHDLLSDIANVIKFADNKAEKLRQYLNVIKLLDSDNEIFAFIFDKIIHALYPDCLDSNLVVEFAETYDFYTWAIFRENPEIVGYVLEHARRIRYNIWASPEWRLDPINACILINRTGNIVKLLEYGTAFLSECRIYMLNIEILADRRINTEVPRRRIFLMTQLLYFFMNNASSWACLLSFWRSIPDPYLRESEIFLAFREALSLTDVNGMIDYNKSNIVKENVQTEDVVPRTLLHLSRVAVRNILSSNFQLPCGIYQLGVGQHLENYLNLQH